MITNDKIFKEVVQFVAQQTGESEHRLTRDTRLVKDLYIDGDDAVDFFIAFQDHFKVDCSSLNLRRHFNPEAFGLIDFTWILRKIRGEKLPKPASKALTLGDLEESVLLGKWVEPA